MLSYARPRPPQPSDARKPYATTTRAAPAFISPTIVPVSPCSVLIAACTASTASGAQAISSPPEVCGSVTS